MHVFELPVTGETSDLEHRLARTAPAAGEELVEGPADHQADELFGIEFRGWRGLDVMAVPEHGDSVGDLEYLLQPVGGPRSVAPPSRAALKRMCHRGRPRGRRASCAPQLAWFPSPGPPSRYGA